MSQFNRRDFLRLAGAAAVGASLSGCAGTGMGGGKAGHVVVVGGGFAGATCAKYIRMWSDGAIAVTLIERNPAFVSCPFSNLVLAGARKLEDITIGYDGLAKNHGVKVVKGEVSGIDAAKKTVQLASGETIAYDRVVVAPGIDFMYESVPGLTQDASESAIPHAWKAGPQTALLRKQLEAMPDGGVYALCIPKGPFRCPPGPYERASLIAAYFKQAKPKSKVLILDANPDIVSKKGLFTKAWADRYAGMIEYRKEHTITGVDVATRTVNFEFGDPVKADVLNIVPAQRAGTLATPFVNKDNRWVGVDWLTMEAQAAKGVHVLGDATASAPGMPKSGHMANQHAKVAAAAIVALMSGEQVNQTPMVTNTCYSFVDTTNVVHVASVHTYDAAEKTFKAVKDAGGLSPAPSELEGKFANAWARNIWADILM
jgi:sulfite dehydrogenase